tara:strand:+ start:487 stop:1332 length:846 start_codon:yes stop_codon:yes gene_type:complete
LQHCEDFLQAAGVAYNKSTIKALLQHEGLSVHTKHALKFKTRFTYDLPDQQKSALLKLFQRTLVAWDVENEPPKDANGMIVRKSPWQFQTWAEDFQKHIMTAVKRYLVNRNMTAAWNELVTKSSKNAVVVHAGTTSEHGWIELMRGVEETAPEDSIKHFLVFLTVTVKPVHDESNTFIGFDIEAKMPHPKKQVLVEKTDLMSKDEKKKTPEGQAIEHEFHHLNRMCNHAAVDMKNTLNGKAVEILNHFTDVPTKPPALARTHTELALQNIPEPERKKARHY